MLGPQAQAAIGGNLIIAASLATTAAATSVWIDVRQIEGDVIVLLSIGAVTGSFTPSFEDATSGAGAGAAAFAPNEALAAIPANQFRKYSFAAKATRGFFRFIGTIVTGPVLGAAVYQAGPKYA